MRQKNTFRVFWYTGKFYISSTIKSGHTGIVMTKPYPLYAKFFLQRSQAAFLSQHAAIPSRRIKKKQPSQTLFMWLHFYTKHYSSQ